MEFIVDTTIEELEAELDAILDAEVDELFKWNLISPAEAHLIDKTRSVAH